MCALGRSASILLADYNYLFLKRGIFTNPENAQRLKKFECYVLLIMIFVRNRDAVLKTRFVEEIKFLLYFLWKLLSPSIKYNVWLNVWFFQLSFFYQTWSSQYAFTILRKVVIIIRNKILGWKIRWKKWNQIFVIFFSKIIFLRKLLSLPIKYIWLRYLIFSVDFPRTWKFSTCVYDPPKNRFACEMARDGRFHELLRKRRERRQRLDALSNLLLSAAILKTREPVYSCLWII